MCSCFCSNLCIVMFRKFRNVPLFKFFSLICSSFWNLKVGKNGVAVQVHWGYSAATALCSSSCWNSCSIPSQLLQLAVATVVLCYKRPISSQSEESGCDIIQIMNVYECSGTNIFIRWKMKCSIQRGKAKLNGTFHLSPNENICSNARMKKTFIICLI